MTQSRNEVIDEVLAAILAVNDHYEPLPEELRERFEDHVKALGIETVVRLGAESLKMLILNKVLALRNE